MASISNQLKDEDKQKTQGQEPVQPKLTTATPAYIGMAGGQGAPGQQQGRFSNIQQFLGANKKGIERVASRVQGGIGRQLGQQQQNIEKETSDIENLRTQQIQENIKKAQGFQTQLGAQGFDAEKFTGAPAPTIAQPAAIPQSTVASQPNQFIKMMPQAGVSTQAQEEQVSPERLAADQARIAKSGGTVEGQQLPPTPEPAPSVFDPEQFKSFVGLRSGVTQQKTAEQLGRESQESLEAIRKANETATQRLAQLGSEQGRTGLLSEFVGGRKGTYGAGGLSRLDQALLQKDPNRAIQNIKQTTQQKRDVDFANMAKVQKTTQTTAEEAQQQSAQLGQQLQQTADTLETNKIQNLEDSIPGFNQKREEEKAALRNTFDILTGKKQGKINQQELDQLNLELGLQSFNVLNDPEFNPASYAKFSEQMAKTYKDVATQRDVEQYKALANLAKAQLGEDGELIGPRADQLKLTEKGNLEEAAQILRDQQGKSLLRGRIDKASQAFMDEALRTVLTGMGKESYGGGLFGGSGESTMYQSANLGDILKQSGYTPRLSGINRSTSPGVAGIAGAVGQLGTGGQLNPANVMGDFVNNIAQNPLNLTGTGLVNTALQTAAQNPLMFTTLGASLAAGGQIANVVSNIASALGGGDSAGAERAAANKARIDLENQINAYLKQKGFGNVITTGGAKDTSDITNQIRESQRSAAEQIKQAQDVANATRFFETSRIWARNPQNFSISSEDEQRIQAMEAQAQANAKSQAARIQAESRAQQDALRAQLERLYRGET